MAKLQPKRLKTSAKKANFPKESLLVRIGVGGHGEKINVYPSLTARPSKFSQRGLPQLERHHQTKQKQYKQMPNTFLAIYFFSLINIVTCGSWGRFAVWLPGGGFSPGNPPVLLLHAWHNITMFSMPGEHHQALSTKSKGAAMGTSSSSLGLRRRALQERAPAEQKKFSPRQNAFPISPPLPWVDVKLFAKLEVSPMENSERIQRMKQLHSLKVTGVEFDGR